MQRRHNRRDFHEIWTGAYDAEYFGHGEQAIRNEELGVSDWSATNYRYMADSKR